MQYTAWKTGRRHHTPTTLKEHLCALSPH